MSTDPSPPSSPAPRRGGRARLLVQVVGFAACLGLLWWVASAVLAPENRAQLERLREASPAQIAGLFILGLATVVINGAIFQCALAPVRRVRTLDLQSINAIAAVLALLPFKLSMIFRVVAHNRRDRLPVLTIAAWFGAVAATMAVSVGPALAASLWRGRIDSAWWATAIGGTIILAIVTIAGARLFSDGAGWAWFERTIRRLPLPRAVRGTPDGSTPGVLPRIHEGLRMLAHPHAVIGCVLLRIADAGIHTARFLVAAAILGVDLPADKAVIAGATFFLIGAAAPTGQVGAREAGTAGMLALLLKGVDLDQFKLVVLLVSATEATVLLFAAAAGAAWLRPWRREIPRV